MQFRSEAVGKGYWITKTLIRCKNYEILPKKKRYFGKQNHFLVVACFELKVNDRRVDESALIYEDTQPKPLQQLDCIENVNFWIFDP
jgi:hypothetical protein